MGQIAWTAEVDYLSNSTAVVKRGDTLCAIAQRELGTCRLWKAIWVLNKKSVPNPNKIEVGTTLKLPGSDELSNLATEDAVDRSLASEIRKDIPDVVGKGEWQRLPRQAWEFDPYGELDISQFVTKVMPLQTAANIKSKKKFLKVFLEKEELVPLGTMRKIEAVDNPQSVGDTILIEFDEATVPVSQQRGVFALVSKPVKIQSDRDGGYSAFAYYVDAVVELDEGAGPFRTAKVIFAYSGIAPDTSFVVPIIEVSRHIKESPSVPGVIARLGVDKSRDVAMAAQFDQVFLDRGAIHGVKPGQLFCLVWGEIRDGENLDNVCSSARNIGIVKALHTTDSFAVAEVVASNRVIMENTTAVSYSEFKASGVSHEHIGITIDEFVPVGPVPAASGDGAPVTGKKPSGPDGSNISGSASAGSADAAGVKGAIQSTLSSALNAAGVPVKTVAGTSESPDHLELVSPSVPVSVDDI
jgi:LysM repeat protein